MSNKTTDTTSVMADAATKNVRNAWLIAIGIMIITGVSWGLYFLINAPQQSVTGIPYSFKVGPVIIAAGERNISNFIGIPRPPELEKGVSCALHWFKFSLVDELDRDVPMESVYVEQVTLFELVDLTSLAIRVLTSAGSESSKPTTNLGTEYAVKANPDTDWGIKWNFFNIWGAASNAPIQVYIKVELRYTALQENKEFKYVEWDMLGMDSETSTSLEATFDVPGTGGIMSKQITGLFLDDTIVVMAWGNLHIGAINITLFRADSPIPIASSKVTYAANGYIDKVERQSFTNTFVSRDQWKLIAYYDNTKAYANATALMQVYRTIPATVTRDVHSTSLVKRLVDTYYTKNNFKF